MSEVSLYPLLMISNVLCRDHERAGEGEIAVLGTKERD